MSTLNKPQALTNSHFSPHYFSHALKTPTIVRAMIFPDVRHKMCRYPLRGRFPWGASSSGPRGRFGCTDVSIDGEGVAFLCANKKRLHPRMEYDKWVEGESPHQSISGTKSTGPTRQGPRRAPRGRRNCNTGKELFILWFDRQQCKMNTVARDGTS